MRNGLLVSEREIIWYGLMLDLGESENYRRSIRDLSSSCTGAVSGRGYYKAMVSQYYRIYSHDTKTTRRVLCLQCE